jgi:uncharacterized protein
MLAEYENLLAKSATRHKEILKNMKHLSKQNKAGFDSLVARFHDEVFGGIDCLQCGHCCKSMSPRFRETDIKLFCKSNGLDQRAFRDDLLKQDEEGVGFVLKTLPCPFQNADNTCSDYEHRTLSCRDFPHTRSRGIQKKLAGLAYDSLVCPAAYLIIEKITAACL